MQRLKMMLHCDCRRALIQGTKPYQQHHGMILCHYRYTGVITRLRAGKFFKELQFHLIPAHKIRNYLFLFRSLSPNHIRSRLVSQTFDISFNICCLHWSSENYNHSHSLLICKKQFPAQISSQSYLYVHVYNVLVCIHAKR